MYRFKRLARILLALALTILGIVVSTPVAQADSALTLRSSEEFDCARYKHFGCFARDQLEVSQRSVTAQRHGRCLPALHLDGSYRYPHREGQCIRDRSDS